MIASEKKIHEITLRVGDTTFILLSELANQQDRSLGEFVRYVIEEHLLGSARSLLDREDEGR